MVFLDYYESPMGKITLAAEGQYLIGLWFDGQKYDRLALKGKKFTDIKEAIKPYLPDLPDLPDLSDVSGLPDSPDLTDVSDLPDSPDLTDVSDVQDFLEESAKPGTSGASDDLYEGAKSVASGTPDNLHDVAKSDISDILEEAVVCSRILGRTRQWLDLYFYGRDPGFNLPLHVEGSELRRTVTKVMLSIPFGATMTYGEIAKKASEILGGKKVSPRSVGGAVGHNSISVIIPCHRVVGSSGSLTGYAGGLDKKSALLALEKNTVHLKFFKSETKD